MEKTINYLTSKILKKIGNQFVVIDTNADIDMNDWVLDGKEIHQVSTFSSSHVSNGSLIIASHPHLEGTMELDYDLIYCMINELRPHYNLQHALTLYIRAEKTQDECIGFIEGYQTAFDELMPLTTNAWEIFFNLDGSVNVEKLKAIN